MLTYNIELNFNDDNQKNYWLNLLEVSTEIYNYISSIVKKENIRPSIKFVHDRCYYEVREKYPDIANEMVSKKSGYGVSCKWSENLSDLRFNTISIFLT